MCVSEKRADSATLRENSPSYVNNLEKEGVGEGGRRTGETRNRSRVNETISKKRGNREARDQNKGGKERGNPTSRGREKGRSEWVERQATRARRSQAVPQVRSWENRNARLRSSKATAPTTRGLAAPYRDRG